MTASTGADTDSKFFRDQVASILERRCVGCHNTADAKGGLALDTSARLHQGGDSGTAVVPGKAAESLILQYVLGDKPEMPKTGPPLSEQEISILRQWIEQGAHWPDDLTLEERPAADNNWWSLQPLVRPPVPENTDTVARSPIDRFIQSRLQQASLSPSPEADRRTLIRRLSYDLIGLPPTPEEVIAFVADPAPDAYEQLVDRLLASPQYGERWARHWLDVVHYGETHGYDKDKLRLNAWPYRDYVIRAFNSDKPYAEFVREQLAGDVLAKDPIDGATALGFIAAGPWDFISHVEVPESKKDGQIARNLDRDDMVVNTLNTFCSTTVQCARCHAHKFDPISQTDYYRLQAVFSALDRADRAFDASPEMARQRKTLLAQQQRLKDQITNVEAAIIDAAGPRYAEVTIQLEKHRSQQKHGFRPPPEHGYHSAIASRDDDTKWVQFDLGAPQYVHAISLHPCYDDFNSIGAGFGFPVRYRLELSSDPRFESDLITLADFTQADVVNPGLSTVHVNCPPYSKGQFLRITATKLATRKNDFIFAMSEVQILNTALKNIAPTAKITALDSIEAPIRWRLSNLVDGIFPVQGDAERNQEIARLQSEQQKLIAAVPMKLQTRPQQFHKELAEVVQQLASLPVPQKVYAGLVYKGEGNFRGTGPDGGKPRPIHVLHRGNVDQPGKEVGPGVPPLVTGFPAEFVLPDNHTEADRRIALAEWIVHRDNPLTWRSIVNRMWHYHFGRGLVDSPNDFGRMGATPSHPELLDWLAIEFRDGGQSLKQLHRLIVTSQTYRQVSDDRPDAARIDANNALLWRANRRKLDAEAIRDSLLFVSGRLNDQMTGPSFQDFVIERPEHSPHFEYRLHDPADPKSHRRSVYRFLVRSQPQPFMTTFDCADPSMSVDKRNETINALQALALLNNGLTLLTAQDLAERVTDSAVEQESLVQRAFSLALSREPTPDELDVLTGYAQQHGLANTCRVILNLNEFAFVD
ncbi:DUF1553 domain-containing protein [bacterium]|nr:DUF1553 domain-containing protein [bacterium]